MDKTSDRYSEECYEYEMRDGLGKIQLQESFEDLGVRASRDMALTHVLHYGVLLQTRVWDTAVFMGRHFESDAFEKHHFQAQLYNQVSQNLLTQ